MKGSDVKESDELIRELSSDLIVPFGMASPWGAEAELTVSALLTTAVGTLTLKTELIVDSEVVLEMGVSSQTGERVPGVSVPAKEAEDASVSSGFCFF